MKNEIQIFNNPEFGRIRVVLNEENEPLFCLSDVAKALGYTRPADAVTAHCKGVVFLPTPTAGGMQSMKYGKEAEVYRLVMRSKLPDAEKFQDWVCEEILPSIRKHGGYLNPNADIDFLDPDKVLVLVQNWKKEKERRLAVEKENEENQPKVLFTNAVIGSKSSCLVGELAKLITQNGYRIGQNRLFKWLRKNGYLGSRGENYNIPNQQYVEQGLFELKKGTRSGNDGVMHTTITPKITGKGQVYFVNKFIKLLKPIEYAN